MSARPITDFESAPVDSKGLPAKDDKDHVHTVLVSDAAAVEEEGRRPTEEELATLPLVAAALPWPAVAMCLIEFAERASYYGSIGPFGNFIRRALPVGGNGAGAVAPGAAGANQSAGALGKGLQTATALTTLFQFLAYAVPIAGGIVADTKWGRFRTIVWGTAVGALAHILLVIPAIPSVISSGNALAPFIISLLILAFAAGFIKPCLGPMLCDQSPVSHQTVIVRKGKKVILDPAVTVGYYLSIFYWSINVGAFFSTATSYAARDVGFWLAFLVPGILYMMMPIVLVIVSKKLYKAPPQGSVVLEFGRVVATALSSGGWKRIFKGGDAFWNRAKPSEILAVTGSLDEKRVIWDDKFVDEIRASLSACVIFLFIPIFNLAAGGMGNVEGAMGAAMTVNGVPNDLISNFNPLTIIVFIPILNYGFYPLMQRITGKPMAPMTKMSIGFFLATLKCIYSAVLQWRVYETSPCGYSATSLSCVDQVSPISLWAQIPMQALPAIGELFINITSYEIAYTRAPARMKGLVYAAVLFTSAISSAITLVVNATPALQDPYLIWSYVALAVLCFLCMIVLPWRFSHMNVVDDFADRARMEGRDRPQAQQAAAVETDFEVESLGEKRKI